MNYKEVEALGYEITSKGQIIGLHGNLLKFMYRGNGRKPVVSVFIKEPGKEPTSRLVSVQIVVAQKYCKIRPEGHDCVLMKDGDTSNTRPSNLRWVTLAKAKKWSIRAELISLGIDELRAGNIGWQEAVKKYKLTGNKAYTIWKEVQNAKRNS